MEVVLRGTKRPLEVAPGRRVPPFVIEVERRAQLGRVSSRCADQQFVRQVGRSAESKQQFDQAVPVPGTDAAGDSCGMLLEQALERLVNEEVSTTHQWSDLFLRQTALH